MAAACGVHSHSRADERKVYEMPTDEKLAAMRGFRTRARVYHDEGHHFRATLWFETSARLRLGCEIVSRGV